MSIREHQSMREDKVRKIHPRKPNHHLLELPALHCEVKELPSVVAQFRPCVRDGCEESEQKCEGKSQNERERKEEGARKQLHTASAPTAP
jgi:hypothetical protein